MPVLKPLLNISTGGLAGALHGGGVKSILSGGVMGSGGQQHQPQGGYTGQGTFPGAFPGGNPLAGGSMQPPGQGQPPQGQPTAAPGQMINQPAQPPADQAWLDRQSRRASGGGFQGAQAPAGGSKGAPVQQGLSGMLNNQFPNQQVKMRQPQGIQQY
jgi:hypothetical protein